MLYYVIFNFNNGGNSTLHDGTFKFILQSTQNQKSNFLRYKKL